MDIFNEFPVLETKRLILKEVSLDRAEQAYEFYSDPEVMKGHGRPGLKTLDEVKDKIQQWYIDPFKQHTGIRFGIYLKDTDRLIGSCGFWKIEEQHFRAETGYELAARFHRNGYMKEALKELARFGFTTMHLNRIEANVDQFNLASQATLESVGFIKEGIKEEAEYEDGSFVDMHSFALLKKDWKENEIVKKQYETERLILKVLDRSYADIVCDYFSRNREFLEEWEPVKDDEFYTEKYHEMQLEKELERIKNGSLLKLWIFKREDESRVIGSVSFDNIIMAAFLSCHLGYRLDNDEINKGYMTEAIRKGTDIVFNDLKLHRIEANIMPKNKRSLRTAEKSGFYNEGLAYKYLNINGKWEDHIHMVLLNDKI